jgi:hypothetical protein
MASMNRIEVDDDLHVCPALRHMVAVHLDEISKRDAADVGWVYMDLPDWAIEHDLFTIVEWMNRRIFERR